MQIKQILILRLQVNHYFYLHKSKIELSGGVVNQNFDHTFHSCKFKINAIYNFVLVGFNLT